MLNSETQLDENGLLQVDYRHNNQEILILKDCGELFHIHWKASLIMMSLNVRDLRLSMTAGQTVVQNG